MKIKLFLILIALWLSPTDSLAISCRGPDGYFSVGCDETRTPTEICTGAGYKFSSVSGSTVYCMDRNCVSADRKDCVRCANGYLLYPFSDYQCAPCPAGATCDGTTQVVSCPDGFFPQGTTCRPCYAGCVTCVDDTNRCTSCRPGYFLYNGSCQPCPSNAACPGGTSFPVCRDGYSHMNPTNPGCVRCRNPSCKSCANGTPDYCTACYSGFKAVNGQCVEDEPEPTKKNTVNSCPSRMTLSSDGCCCINK